MLGLTLLVLLQTAALLYLLYRVDRLEKALAGGGRSLRRGPGDPDRKVIPLLKEELPPGPFRGKAPTNDPPRPPGPPRR